MWAQFRRLLLGTVIEALLEVGAAVDFPSIRIEFDDDSVFRVPRLNNYMRFEGALSARLSAPFPAAKADALRVVLKKAWPEILSVVDIPIGDRLTNERNHIAVSVDGDQLRVAFDLEAD